MTVTENNEENRYVECSECVTRNIIENTTFGRVVIWSAASSSHNKVSACQD